MTGDLGKPDLDEIHETFSDIASEAMGEAMGPPNAAATRRAKKFFADSADDIARHAAELIDENVALRARVSELEAWKEKAVGVVREAIETITETGDEVPGWEERARGLIEET